MMTLGFTWPRDYSSSGGISDEDYEEEDAKWERNKRMTTTSTKKKKNKRAMLGLEESESEDEDIGDDSELLDGKDDEYGEKSNVSKDSGNKLEFPHAKSESQSSEEVEDTDNSDKDVRTKDLSNQRVTFMPGKQVLEGRIRSKLSGVDLNGLSPYEKYLEKRKDKRRERRQAVRNARKKKDQGNDDGRENDSGNNDHDDYDGMYDIDPDFGVAKFSDEESDDCAPGGKTSGGIVSKDGRKSKREKMKQYLKSDNNNDGADKVASTKEELELLVVGDDGEYLTQMILFFLSNLVHNS